MARNLSRRTLGLGLGAVALTGVGGWWLTGLRPAAVPSQPRAAGLGAAEAQTVDAASGAAPLPDLVLGNPDAKVTVIEYASYTCIHCANFHANVFKDLKSNYIDTGKIRFVYREVYFLPQDRLSFWAPMVARCGGENRYFGISDMLYARRDEWILDNAAGAVDGLRRIGRTAGLTDEQIDACLQDTEMAQAMLDTHETHRIADDISSTPTLIINGRKYGNMSYADLSRLIDAELAN